MAASLPHGKMTANVNRKRAARRRVKSSGGVRRTQAAAGSHRLRKSAWSAALLAVSLASTFATLRAQTEPSPCASCHDQGPALDKSAHAGLTCDGCHNGHDEFPHAADMPKPACFTCHGNQAQDYAEGVHGQARKNGDEAAPDCATCHGGAHELLSPHSAAFREAVLDTCGSCHPDAAQQFRASVHGQALIRGVVDAPTCINCHGGHKILKHTDGASAVYRSNLRDTCGSCHGDVRLARKFGMPADRLVSFDSSFHGLSARAGSQTVASCASCHGIHNILASSDPSSTINAENLRKTCGQCHPGAGSRFAISQVHLVEGRSEPPSLRWVRRLYLLLIPAILGLMLLHNLGDWVRKLIRARFTASIAIGPAGPRGESGELRMLPFERVQHAALAISFLTLAWTGFALKYPDQWWAQPLLWMEGERSVRSWVHRAAAVVFLATALTHVASLILNRKLRRHWKMLMPKISDLREGMAGLTYNLGLHNRPPKRTSHGYVEKTEYLGVVWGTVIMAVTGVLLWANNLMLQLLPKVWLDVATSVHFYEAVLATAVIAVWHFYSAILDPDVYPMDTAFLSGFRAKRAPAPTDEAPPKTR
jgi:cytochrome b subunit of formate dehydrogenase